MILAYDDGPHLRDDLLNYRNGQKTQENTQSHQSPLVAVACKGLQLIHVDHTYIDVDGLNSTDRILELYQRCPFRPELRVIMIDSPTMGGFNILNPFRIHAETGLPVLLVPDSQPRSPIVEVYRHVFPDRTAQIEVLQQLPPLEDLSLSIKTDPNVVGKVYFHVIGAEKPDITGLLSYLAEYSLIPEPLRLAHIIAANLRLK